jgi:hypothetical protein
MASFPDRRSIGSEQTGPKAVTFDVDATSLASLRGALPGWQIETFNEVTASSVARACDPGAADLLVVGARGDGEEALEQCGFLTFCTCYSEDFRRGPGQRPEGGDGRGGPARRPDAPLLVLVSPGQDVLARAALAAGAHSCLVRPVHAKEVVRMLAHARAGNQPGRHTGPAEAAQAQDLWRDDGGEG